MAWLGDGEGEVGKTLEGFEGYPLVGLYGVGAAGFEVAGGTVEEAAAVSGGGSSPAALGSRGRVVEHQWKVGELLGGLIRVEKGWKEELGGGLGGGGGHGGQRRHSRALGELGLGFLGVWSGEGGPEHGWEENEGGEELCRGARVEAALGRRWRRGVRVKQSRRMAC